MKDNNIVDRLERIKKIFGFSDTVLPLDFDWLTSEIERLREVLKDVRYDIGMGSYDRAFDKTKQDLKEK